MLIVDQRQDGMYSMPAKEIKLTSLKSISSKLARQILRQISIKPTYPKELSKLLKEHEQKIYYHVRKLEKSGLIRLLKKEQIQGGSANIYCLKEDAFLFKFKDLKLNQKLPSKNVENKFLEPFIENNTLNALIVVGSPDPHGPDKARSRDGYYGIDFALFLGTYLNYVPQLNVKLDTEVRQEDLDNNLILIGGPVTNKITEKFNDTLPIKFENGNIKSNISNIIYHTDETGLIVKASNKFNKQKRILVIAGRRHAGTRAAIISFLKKFNQLTDGNRYSENTKARVVEGIDLDSDGIVDDVEFLE